MKNFKSVVLFGALVLTGVMAAGCATTGASSVPSTLGPDESVVVVQRKKSIAGSAISMRVYIDGEYKISVGNGRTERIIVPNGEHSIWGGSTKIDSSSSLPFMVYSEEITFFATPKFGLIAADFVLQQTGKREL
jgi:hypothetical protein